VISGASGQPSLLTWPIIELNTVPAIHSGRQARSLLEKSEFIYPRINAAGTITNLTLTIMAYFHRDTHMNASAKWPILLTALACNVATTVWALTVMVPINDNIRKSSNELEHSKDDSEAERNFRRAVITWKKYAVGEFFCPFSARVMIESVLIRSRSSRSFDDGCSSTRGLCNVP
jgi:hypothetical protein